jgi:hypothetical protein
MYDERLPQCGQARTAMKEAQRPEQFDNSFGACLGQCLGVGVLQEEAFIEGLYKVGSRALKQQFRDQNRVGVVAAPPRKLPPTLSEPREHSPTQPSCLGGRDFREVPR